MSKETPKPAKAAAAQKAPPKSVKKRNGETVPFDAAKIQEAIRKACVAVPEEKISKKKLEEFDKEDAELLVMPPEEVYDMRMNGGIVYPGTEVRIGMAKLKVKQETRQCTARLIDGQVCIL